MEGLEEAEGGLGGLEVFQGGGEVAWEGFVDAWAVEWHV